MLWVAIKHPGVTWSGGEGQVLGYITIALLWLVGNVILVAWGVRQRRRP